MYLKKVHPLYLKKTTTLNSTEMISLKKIHWFAVHGDQASGIVAISDLKSKFQSVIKLLFILVWQLKLLINNVKWRHF